MPIADEDVLRELLHRATEDVHAPSAVTAGIVSRHRRRLRSTRILSITTTSVAAAAALAAVVVPRVGPSARGHAQPPAALPATELPATELPATELPAVKLPPVKLTAVQVLDHLSVVAADAPQSTGRYIALTEMDLYPDTVYPANFPSEFLNPKLSPLGKKQLQQMVMEYGVERTSVFDAVTGDVWAYQRGAGVPGTGPVAAHWSPTRAEFAAWPTNPAKLRALLVRQAGQTVGLDIIGVTVDRRRPGLRGGHHLAVEPAAQPGPAIRDVQGARGNAWGDGQDRYHGRGRPAIEISRYDSFEGMESTFESPGTGAMLEQDFTDAGPAVYAAVTGYATPPANPYRG